MNVPMNSTSICTVQVIIEILSCLLIINKTQPQNKQFISMQVLACHLKYLYLTTLSWTVPKHIWTVLDVWGFFLYVGARA